MKRWPSVELAAGSFFVFVLTFWEGPAVSCSGMGFRPVLGLGPLFWSFDASWMKGQASPALQPRTEESNHEMMSETILNARYRT